jgi:hypothetical protein
MQRDLFAGFRAISENRPQDATDVWAKYSAPDAAAQFIVEAIEVTSAVVAIAANFGLPVRRVLEHFVAETPSERRPVFRDAVDLLNAVNDGASREEQSRTFADDAERREFFVALWNIATYIVRQTARRHQMTEAELYDALEKAAPPD